MSAEAQRFRHLPPAPWAERPQRVDGEEFTCDELLCCLRAMSQDARQIRQLTASAQQLVPDAHPANTPLIQQLIDTLRVDIERLKQRFSDASSALGAMDEAHLRTLTHLDDDEWQRTAIDRAQLMLLERRALLQSAFDDMVSLSALILECYTKLRNAVAAEEPVDVDSLAEYTLEDLDELAGLEPDDFRN